MAQSTPESYSRGEEREAPRPVCFGIRRRLLTAFASVSSLTIIACTVALISYQFIGASFSRLQSEGLGAVALSLDLARAASDLAAASSVVAGVDTEAQLRQKRAELERKRLAIFKDLDALAKIDISHTSVSELQQKAEDLGAGIEALAASVKQRLEASSERAGLVEKLVAAHQKVNETVAPLTDDASFGLTVTLQSASESADDAKMKDELMKLAYNDITMQQAFQDLRADANYYLGSLIEAALAPRAELFAPLRDRITGGAQRIRRSVAQLTEIEKARELLDYAENLLRFGEGPADVLEARRRELEHVANAWKLVAANQEKAQSLAAAVEKLVEQANAVSDRAGRSSHSVIRGSEAILVALTVVALASAGLAWRYVRRRILQRLERLHSGIEALANGDLDVDIPCDGNDELARIADSVEVLRRHAATARELELRLKSEFDAKDKRQQAMDACIAAFDRSAKELSDILISSSQNIERTAAGMSVIAGEASREADEVKSAAEAATTDAQEAAAACEQVSQSIRNVATNVGESSRIAERAVADARSADLTVQSLAKAAGQIGQVVELISKIAGQTNMLALNATIEAARAGEAGKGFAVVASEVKGLAEQTGKATADIQSKIGAIQSTVAEAVKAIDHISGVIGSINQISCDIASSMSMQEKVAQIVSDCTRGAAGSAVRLGHNAEQVDNSAASANEAARSVLDSAKAVAKNAATIRDEIDRFLTQIRAA